MLADLILGHTPVVAVEWEPYACQVLRERAADGWFPGLRVWEGDVRLFDPSEYAGSVDCIHAGFPCQDVSLAGGQAGLGEGTRSGLYREVLRIARIIRPRKLYFENVTAIIGGGLEHILADLAAMGFSARWCCLRASDVGCQHRRDRWWLLADSEGFDGETRDSVEPCGERGSQIATGRLPSPSVLAGWGEADFWTASPPIFLRNDDGVANGVHRLHAIGNGQDALQAAAAWRLLGGE